MQNIHIQRYEDPKSVGYQGTVTPENRSWVLWIKSDGTPELFRRVETSANEDGTGDTIEGYVSNVVYEWPPGVPMPEHIASTLTEAHHP